MEYHMMMNSIWPTSVDDILIRTNKETDTKHKSKEDFSVTRKNSLGSDSSSNKSEKLSMKDRFQIKIKKFWHNRTFISLPYAQAHSYYL